MAVAPKISWKIEVTRAFYNAVGYNTEPVYGAQLTVTQLTPIVPSMGWFIVGPVVARIGPQTSYKFFVNVVPGWYRLSFDHPQWGNVWGDRLTRDNYGNAFLLYPPTTTSITVRAYYQSIYDEVSASWTISPAALDGRTRGPSTPVAISPLQIGGYYTVTCRLGTAIGSGRIWAKAMIPGQITNGLMVIMRGGAYR